MSTQEFKNLTYLTSDVGFNNLTSKPTGSATQGGYAYFYGNFQGFGAVNSFTGNNLKNAYSLEDRRRIVSTSNGFIDENFIIRAGTYIYIAKITPSGASNLSTEAQNMLLEGATIVRGANPNRVCYNSAFEFRPNIMLVNFSTNRELKCQFADFILMESSGRGSFVKDFEELSYTSGSENRVSDSMSFIAKFNGSQAQPVFTEKIDSVKTSRFSYNDTMVPYNANSAKVESQGVYLTFNCYRNGDPSWSGTDPRFVFSMHLCPKSTTDDDMNVWTVIDNPVQTFGHINYSGGYTKRLSDIRPYKPNSSLSDFDNTQFVPQKRPLESSVISEMYFIDYTQYQDATTHIYTLR